MKKVLLILVSIVSAVMLINTNSIYGQGLYDVASPDLLTVYAAGDGGRIFRSINAGASYGMNISGMETFRSVHAVGYTAWCAGDNGSFSRSTDRGLTWNNQIIGGGANLRSVNFTDSLTGYIAGANGLILKSSDGGNSWASVSSGTSNTLNRVRFLNSATGYIAGDNGFFASTTNAGASWVPLTLPTTRSVKTFDVFNNTIVLGLDASEIVISSNGGASWTLKKLNIISMPAVVGIELSSDTAFTLALESGSIWNSTNSGVAFTYASSPMYSRISAFSAYTQRGYAVSPDHTVILRTVSNLNLWSFPNSVAATISFEILLQSQNGNKTHNKIFNINYQKRGTFYCLQKNVLKRTSDFGVTWSQLSVLPPDSMSQQLIVSIKDSSKMVAVMNTYINQYYAIKVYRTSDYGVNWQHTFTGEKVDFIGNLIAQDPSHPDTLYMGARDSTYRSTDFGATWLKISEYPFDDWCDIAVSYSNPEIIYASTNHYPAKLHKSTNAGVNWTMVDFLMDTNFSEMPAIALTNHNPNTVIHVQLGGISGNQTGLKRSYTGGGSWLFNLFPADLMWSLDIAKDDPGLYAHGSVSYTPVYLTSNAGGNFTATPNQYAEQILYYDRANLFVNSHGEISKLKAHYTMPVIGIEQISSNVPESYSLEQNYPNPFNPVTNIKFNVPKAGITKLVVYDIMGRIVETLVEQHMQPGTYKYDWDASGYSSGFYFYRLTSGEFTETKKMVLVK